MALVLSAILAVGLVFGAAEKLRELETTAGRSVLGYWVGGVLGPLIYYGLRPWHRTWVGLITAGTLAVAGGFFGFFLSVDPAGVAFIAKSHAYVFPAMSVIPGIVLSWYQRHADEAQGLIKRDA